MVILAFFALADAKSVIGVRDLHPQEVIQVRPYLQFVDPRLHAILTPLQIGSRRPNMTWDVWDAAGNPPFMPVAFHPLLRAPKPGKKLRLVAMIGGRVKFSNGAGYHLISQSYAPSRSLNEAIVEVPSSQRFINIRAVTACMSSSPFRKLSANLFKVIDGGMYANLQIDSSLEAVECKIQREGFPDYTTLSFGNPLQIAQGKRIQRILYRPMDWKQIVFMNVPVEKPSLPPTSPKGLILRKTVGDITATLDWIARGSDVYNLKAWGFDGMTARQFSRESLASLLSTQIDPKLRYIQLTVTESGTSPKTSRIMTCQVEPGVGQQFSSSWSSSKRPHDSIQVLGVKAKPGQKVLSVRVGYKPLIYNRLVEEGLGKTLKAEVVEEPKGFPSEVKFVVPREWIGRELKIKVLTNVGKTLDTFSLQEHKDEVARRAYISASEPCKVNRIVVEEVVPSPFQWISFKNIPLEPKRHAPH